MQVDWTKVQSIRAALAAGVDAKQITAELKGANAKVDKAIQQLTLAELVALAKLGGRLPSVLLHAANDAAQKKDFQATLRIHDSLIEVPATQLPPSTGVQALLYVQDDENKLGVMPERAHRYLDHYLPIGTSNTPIFTNATFVLIELGELGRAVEQLRLAKLAGDPDVDRWMSHEAYAPLRRLPSFAAVASLTPAYPRALRWLQLQLDVYNDTTLTDQAQEMDLDWVADDLTQGTELYPEVDAALFKVFASLPDGGELAFWQREPGQDIVEQPIVVFGSDGTLSVYADSLLSFFCLFAHGWSLHEAEHCGFHFGDAKPPAVAKKLKKLKAKKSVLAKLAKGGIEVGDRDANEARHAALRLLPTWHALVVPMLKAKR